jgi:outer membrane protein assembly factor BamA
MHWLLVFALALLPVSAQQRTTASKKAAPAKTGPAPTSWPIRTFSVEGNRNYTERQIITVAGLKVGDVAGKKDFEAARDRLLASGAFESVGYRFEPSKDGAGYSASFQVTESDDFYVVRFQGFSTPEAELKAHLEARDPLFGPKVPGTAPFLKRYAEALGQKIGEKVAGKVVSTGPDQFEIVFRPDRPIPVVANVTFEGNQVIPSTLLTERISGVAFGFPFSEGRFRELLDTSIRPLYDARGRIRVAFPKIVTERSKEVDGLDVKVTVSEGESYSLGEVTLEGADPKLLKTANIRTGDVANFDEVNAGVDRVKKELSRRGYLRSTVRAERKVEDKAKSVDVVLQVEPGPQYKFGDLTIEGLDIIGEPAVRRFWGLKSGDPYNAEYPEAFLARVREEQMFDNLGKTTSSAKIDDENRTVDVTLKFAGDAPPPKKKDL